MGLFDLFSGKKKERERQEQLRLQQEAEAKRRAEEKRRQEEARRANEQRQDAILSNFDFDSNCHQRYENGTPVQGLQVCPRYIKIRNKWLFWIPT